MKAFRRLALATTITTIGVVGVGGLVRATGSGKGCPAWPKCFGRWFPPLEYHAIGRHFGAHIDHLMDDVVPLGGSAPHRRCLGGRVAHAASLFENLFAWPVWKLLGAGGQDREQKRRDGDGMK